MPLRPLLATALVGLLTACSAGSATPEEAPEPAPASPTAPAAPESAGPRLDYVALGDSFTAAPGLPGSTLPCLRSEQNYPALVADDLATRFRVELDDRSCVGADTSSVASPQQLGGSRLPPQAASVDRRTDLVTLSLGGNDDDFFVRLLTGCLGLTASADAPCEVAPLVASLTDVQDRLVAAVDDVRRRAPDAEVVVVGYPLIVPERATCDGVPEDPAARAVARRANRALVDTVAGAAAESGAAYVDVARASRGHELCSDDPWVNGAGSDPSGAIPFHPLPAGQRAIADLVVESVRR